VAGFGPFPFGYSFWLWLLCGYPQTNHPKKNPEQKEKPEKKSTGSKILIFSSPKKRPITSSIAKV